MKFTSVPIEDPLYFCNALICNRALNGDLQIGQLLAWYLRESAHAWHKHKCLHGSIKVSRISLIQITHSKPPSSISSSTVSWYYFKQNSSVKVTRKKLKEN